MELLVVLTLMVLLGLVAAVAGVDSRDAADWRHSRSVELATNGFRGRA